MPQAAANTVEFPKRLPLAAEPENRDEDTSKDAKIVNGYMEKDKRGELWWYKRAGLLATQALSGAGNGAYNWKEDVYTVYGTALYKNGVSIGTVDGTGGVYAFCSTLGPTAYLVLGNGVKAYVYDGSTLKQIASTIATDTAGAFVVGYTYEIVTIGTTDFTLIGASANTIGVVFSATGVGTGTGTASRSVAFPTSFVKGWSFLDGTLYVMDKNAVIYGSGVLASGVTDPFRWDPLNVIIAQIEPDSGMALSKQLVYTIAFKQWTTEVFYDAGNATGSPLSPVQGAKINWGCENADTVQSIDDILLWKGSNRSAAPVIMIMDNLKSQKISTKPVERLLAAMDQSQMYSWQFRQDGHRFYGLTSVVSNITLVYDLDEDRWYQWTDGNGNYWPISAMTYTSVATNVHYAQHASNGKLFSIDRDYTNDDGTEFAADLYTPLFDGGVDRRKMVNVLHLEGDKIPGCVVQVRYSDDDYTTWSHFRSVDMGRSRPRLTSTGTFYRRAYHFHCLTNTKMRLRAGDWQVALGTL